MRKTKKMNKSFLAVNKVFHSLFTTKKRGRKKNYTRQQQVFAFLVIIVFILGVLNIAQAKGWLIPAQPELKIKNGVVKLSSMTLEQKIGQMVVVAGIKANMPAWRNMQVGGVHLYALQTESIYNNTIIDFQYEMPIPFFITADFEGCVSPFIYIINSTANVELENLGDAFEKGFKDGAFMKNLGFNLNFAPVVDLDDQIWKCRTFPGNEEEIAEFAQAYILGLQTQGIIATAKHYPGKTLSVKDPHKFIVAAQIASEDVFPYDYLADKGDVKAVMVSHLITTGEVESEGVPAVVSEKVIGELKEEFDGLIISDEIHMLGLKNYYYDLDGMYIGVFKAGNDIILNFDNDPNEIYRMIQVVKKAVEDGILSEDAIDESVTKILELKGLRVR